MKKQLGARIKEIRKKRKLTQANLAEIIGIDSKYISKIETSNGTPSLELLEKIAKALCIEINDLFNKIDTKSKEELDKEIVSCLKKLNMRDTKIVFGLVNSLSTF